jgi:hypothetical protein
MFPPYFPEEAGRRHGPSLSCGQMLKAHPDCCASTNLHYYASSKPGELACDERHDCAVTYAGEGQSGVVDRNGITFHNDFLGVARRTNGSAIEYYSRERGGTFVSERHPSGGNGGSYSQLFDGLGSIVASPTRAAPSRTASSTTLRRRRCGRRAGRGALPLHRRLQHQPHGLQNGRTLVRPSDWTLAPTGSRDDPLTHRGWNRYGSSGGDPVNYVDGSGLQRRPQWVTSTWSIDESSRGRVIRDAETARSTGVPFNPSQQALALARDGRVHDRSP